MSDQQFTIEDLDEMERSVAEIEKRMTEREAQGLADIYKYFDRLNDKLSSFNNMLVAGYFALAAFSPGVSKWILFFPLLNMSILIYLDYTMMEQGRFMSEVKSKSLSEINKYGKRQDQVTRWSFFTIVTTAIATGILLYIVNDVVIPNRH